MALEDLRQNVKQYGIDHRTSSQVPWGDIATAGIDYFRGNRDARDVRQAGDRGATLADPFASQRPQYQQQLATLMSDPSSITQTPGYQFQLDQGIQALRRNKAATGESVSGARDIALMEYGQGLAQTQYQTQLENLMRLAGVDVGSPGAAGAITAGSGQSAVESRNAGEAGLAKVAGDVAGNYLNDKVAGLFSGGAAAGTARDALFGPGAQGVMAAGTAASGATTFALPSTAGATFTPMAGAPALSGQGSAIAGLEGGAAAGGSAAGGSAAGSGGISAVGAAAPLLMPAIGEYMNAKDKRKRAEDVQRVANDRQGYLGNTLDVMGDSGFAEQYIGIDKNTLEQALFELDDPARFYEASKAMKKLRDDGGFERAMANPSAQLGLEREGRRIRGILMGMPGNEINKYASQYVDIKRKLAEKEEQIARGVEPGRPRLSAQLRQAEKEAEQLRSQLATFDEDFLRDIERNYPGIQLKDLSRG